MNKNLLPLLGLLALTPIAGAQDAVVPVDFPTIGAALTGAADLDADGVVHIFVQAGVYPESLLVQRNGIRLEGAGAATTTIQGQTGLRAVHVQAMNGFEISGFTVLGDPQRDGIDVNGADQVSIHDNVVSGTQDGIRINRSSNVAVFANTATGNTHSGIKLKGGQFNSFAMNTCTGNFSHGIDVDRTAECTISGNTCTGNSSNGIRVRRSPNVTVDANTCTTNNDNGMRVEDVTASTFTTNICTGNVSNGLRIRDVTGCLFDGNDLTGNGEYGIRMRDSLANDWDAAQAGSQSAPGTNAVTGNTLGEIRID